MIKLEFPEWNKLQVVIKTMKAHKGHCFSDEKKLDVVNVVVPFFFYPVRKVGESVRAV
jgi:hypothetical protein